ncbi:MAG: hypothetical protein EZS28_047449, partial [Streblomastix strix]
VESSAAVQSGIYKQVISIAAGKTENLFEGLLNTLEASLVATGEAQAVREGQLDGIQQRTTQEEIISDTSRKRFTERNKVSKEVFGKSRSRFQRFGLGRGNYQRSRGRNQANFNYRFNRSQKQEEQRGRFQNRGQQRTYNNNRFQQKEE